MYLVYGIDVGYFVTSVKVWVAFTEFNFYLGCFMISWESYLGSSVIVFILKIKYMTLTFAAKKSLCFMIFVMVFFYQPIFAFLYCDWLSSDQVLDVWEKLDMAKFHSE